jgi:hypothetical protein
MDKLGSDKNSKLAMAINITIANFTRYTPMTILDIVEVLMFMAGHAAAQKQAKASLPPPLRDPRRLREYAMEQFDRGFAEGSIDRTRAPKFISGN